MKRIIAAALGLTMVLTVAACSKKTEEGTTTTVTGMVTAINGSVISLVEMNGNGQMGGERPSRPENMEGFENFEGFEGGENPWGEGEMPSFPEGEMPDFEGGEMPQRPTGEDGEFVPFGDGQMPNFEGGEMPDMGKFEYDGEVTEIDIGSAHISVQDGDIKASGSLSDIQVGSFVTITRNEKGEVTNVLVTSTSGFGDMGGFRDFGDFAGRGEKPTEGTAA